MTAAHGLAIAAGVVLLCGGLFWGAATYAREFGWREVAQLAGFILLVTAFSVVVTGLIAWGFGA